MMESKKMNHSQACRVMGCSRSAKYYEHKMRMKDAPVKQAIEKVITNSRKGRMKVIKLVQKTYPHFGSSRIRRIYEQGGFILNKKLKRRVMNNPVNPIVIPTKRNEEWGIDIMSDALVDGRKIRTLNMIDHYNRLCLGIMAKHNLPALRVIEMLEKAIEKHGKPRRIRTDNGPEFTSKRFQKWLQDNHIAWSKIPKGRPDQNAIIERFNRSYRQEVLDANLFYTIDEAQQLTENWVHHYNHEWPHQSLDFKTPVEYAAA